MAVGILSLIARQGLLWRAREGSLFSTCIAASKLYKCLLHLCVNVFSEQQQQRQHNMADTAIRPAGAGAAAPEEGRGKVRSTASLQMQLLIIHLVVDVLYSPRPCVFHDLAVPRQPVYEERQ